MNYSTILSFFYIALLSWGIYSSIYNLFKKSKIMPEVGLVPLSQISSDQLVALKEINLSLAAKYNQPVVRILWDSSNTIFATAISLFNKKFIILSEGVFLKLSPEAVKAVLAHELGHIYRKDSEKIWGFHVFFKILNSSLTVLFTYLLESSPFMKEVLKYSSTLGFSGMIICSFIGYHFLSKFEDYFLSSYHFNAEFAADKFAMENVGTVPLRETLLRLKEQNFNTFAFMNESSLKTHPKHDDRISKTVEFDNFQKEYTSPAFKL